MMKPLTTWKTFRDEFIRDEAGQDLIEYALIAALIALAATVGMSGVATAINEAFSSIGAKLKSYSS
ncbi:MAG: Flp family type IVb pilin [Terriglobia bacterium]